MATVWKQDPGLENAGSTEDSFCPGNEMSEPLSNGHVTQTSAKFIRSLIHSSIHCFHLLQAPCWVRKTPQLIKPTCFLVDPGLAACRQARPFRVSVLEPPQ